MSNDLFGEDANKQDVSNIVFASVIPNTTKFSLHQNQFQ